MDIPFYKNYGHRCAQTAMKSILKVKLPERDFTFKELDDLTLHQDPQITFPTQIAYGFHQLQIPFEYYIKPQGLIMIQSPSTQNYIEKTYGHEITSDIDFIAIRKSAKTIQDYPGIITTKDKPSIKTLEEKIKNQKIPICLVNWDTFNKRPNKYSGHYIILTNIENNKVTYHDNGPCGAEPNKKMSIRDLQKAWNLCLIDHDLIIV